MLAWHAPDTRSTALRASAPRRSVGERSLSSDPSWANVSAIALRSPFAPCSRSPTHATAFHLTVAGPGAPWRAVGERLPSLVNRSPMGGPSHTSRGVWFAGLPVKTGAGRPRGLTLLLLASPALPATTHARVRRWSMLARRRRVGALKQPLEETAHELALSTPMSTTMSPNLIYLIA